MGSKIERKPNTLLRCVREWHSLSQQQVAEHIGTTPLSVSRWERGLVLPGPHFRRALCALFNKNPFELGFMTVEVQSESAMIHQQREKSELKRNSGSLSACT